MIHMIILKSHEIDSVESILNISEWIFKNLRKPEYTWPLPICK